MIYISWSSVFALHLEDYIILWDCGSVWHDVWRKKKYRSLWSMIHYAPNLEIDGACWFWVVHPSVQEPSMLGFWNFINGFLMEKYLAYVFFSCPSYLPSWSYAPLNKIWMKSGACHILWTVHARVLKGISALRAKNSPFRKWFISSYVVAYVILITK